MDVKTYFQKKVNEFKRLNPDCTDFKKAVSKHRFNTKKVNCERCNKKVYFSELKNVGGKFSPYLVCRGCQFAL